MYKRQKKGNRIGKSETAHFLKNPIYYGAFKWKDKLYQGSHAPLISKEMFDKAHDTLTGKFRPSISKKDFSFNNLIICGICDCKVIGEQKKKRYNYYHCTFSKGRHNGIGYIREEKLADMFNEPIKDVTLSEDITDWLKEGLRNSDKNALELQENRLNSLKTHHGKVNSFKQII